jgi:cytidylate kinase
VFGSVIPPLEDPVHASGGVGDAVWERVEASIVQMADETGGVIVGRGATWVLRGHSRALHVRLDGPRDRRVAQAMLIEQIDEAEARRRQATIDRTRARYVKRFYDVDSSDPSLYHVVLDSTVVPLDACADVIARAARARFGSRP